jgi:RimJ/RimL family protein N-acetyltransferase
VTRLAGHGVTLRGFRDDELDRLVEVTEAWPQGDGVHWGRRSHDELRQKIEASGRWTDAVMIDFAIEEKGRLVGEIQARQPRHGLPRGVFELGVEVYEGADRGRGVGGRAVAELTDHLFREERAHRVQLSTDVDNAAMRRVAERAGFVFEGVLRGFMPTADGPRDYAMYAITRADHDDRNR